MPLLQAFAMGVSMVRKRVLCIAVWVAVLNGGVAHAYVPPAEYLCKLLAQRRGEQGLRDLSLQLLTESNEQTRTERIFLKAPERMRRVTETSASQEYVYVQREGKHAEGPVGEIARLSQPISDLTAQLLFPMGSELTDKALRMLVAMRAIGVNTQQVALGRFKGRIAYIIGARVWEPDQPQVWLDKASMMPVKVSGRTDKTGFFEMHFLEYGSAVTGNWFPRVIERYRGGSLVARSEVMDVKRDQKLPETLFAIP